MSLIDIDDVRGWLNISDTDTAATAKLQQLIDGITDVIEREKGIVTATRTITDEITVSAPASAFLLPSVPVQSITSAATLDGATTWDPANWHVNGKTGRVTILSGAPLLGNVAVTYVAGSDTVPQEYADAAQIIIQHIWATQRGVGGVQNGVLDALDHRGGASTYSIPNKARELLGMPMPGIA